MSYTAPSGSVWQVTNNSDIKAGSNYYKAYSGEYRGDPDQNPKNDMQQSCSFACDSRPDCSGWSLASSGGHCYITGGNNTGLQYSNGNKAYVRTSARPTGKYATSAQGVTLGYGNHYCQGYSWVSGDSEGQEVQNSGGRWCVENYPRPSRCPADLGTPITGNLVNKTNGAGINYATGTNNLGVLCSYNTIPESIIFDSTKMDRYFDTSSDQIKIDFCKSLSPSRLVGDRVGCETILGTPIYIQTIINKCIADTSSSWTTQTPVINKLKSIIHTNGTGNGDVINLFQTFCGGDPIDTKALGGNRMDPRCACINASNFGIEGTSNCFDNAMKNFPGCKTTGGKVGLVEKFGPIVRYPDKSLVANALASFTARPGCLTASCTEAGTNTTSYTLPITAAPCPNVVMQFCANTINIGAAENSPINASCENTAIINPPAGTPTAGTQPAGTPGTGTPAPAPAPATPEDEEEKKKKNKLIWGLFFIFIICCCLMVIGIGFAAMSGGENSGPTGPSASNLAQERLGALLAKI